jgi:hypothetical protein
MTDPGTKDRDKGDEERDGSKDKGERTLSHKGRSANDFPEKYPCGRFFLVPTRRKRKIIGYYSLDL